MNSVAFHGFNKVVTNRIFIPGIVINSYVAGGDAAVPSIRTDHIG
jgi:hypothetical protein